MNREKDISILITDKKFQALLAGWKDLTADQKKDVYKKYNLTADELKSLQQLYFGLDFRPNEIASSKIEESLNNTIWKLSTRNTHSEKKQITHRIYQQFARVAAILIIPLIIYLGYIQFSASSIEDTNLITVCSQMGTVSKLTLPDGSLVWLNAGSSISYPTVFSKNQREVSLKGEGYFDVVKNKSCPMVVSTENVDLKVYGTQFNVNAFAQDKTISVTLVEGSVSMTTPQKKNEFFIKPGETVTYNKDSKKMSIDHDDTFTYTAWKDGILVFKNTSFKDVLQRLSRRFNVDIELKDQSLASIPMDATFKNETIDDILKLLSLSTSFSYQYEPTKKLNDGTYQKTNIYIERNNKN